MVSYLKNVDIYGLPFSLNTFGQTKFKTTFGGFLSIVTLTIICLCTYLFGTDFWHKENPNVIPDQLVHLVSKKIKIPNERFSFMVSLHDQFTKPYLDKAFPFKLFGNYFHVKKDDNGVSETLCNITTDSDAFSPCSNTKATLNKDLKEGRLDHWQCWDMEKVKETSW